MTNFQLPMTMGRWLFPLVVGHWLLVIAVSSCGNPRVNNANGTQPDSSGVRPQPAQTASLRPGAKAGDRFRTTRVLRVEEETGSERYATESEEVTLTEVLRVDDTGRMLAVRRAWECSVTRFTKGYGSSEEARGALDGCTLELTQRAGRVEARVLVGDVSVAGANFLIEGFDTALLPLDPVRESDFWVLEGSHLSGLSGIIEAMEFKIEKNSLTCQVVSVTPDEALISLDWKLSGEMREVASVLEFSGEFTFDRRHALVSAFSLKGGRQGRHGQQVEISITRRTVNGWLDLEK